MSALSIAAALAGSAAAVAYLDAKYHISSDLSLTRIDPASPAAQKFMSDAEAQGRLLNYHLLEDHAEANRPGHLFLEFEDRSWTYREMFDCVQRVGIWMIDELGIQPGEMVAISGPNSPEYMQLWFALQGVGAAVAHINAYLTGDALVHSISLSEARYLLVDEENDYLISPKYEELEKAGIKVVFYTRKLLDSFVYRRSIPRECNNWHTPNTTTSLIYTSGTTGLPKGVVLWAGRELLTSRSMATYLNLKESDKFYTCLPLYHAAAQGLCTMPVLYAGASMRLARKFSHKTFWPDVYESGATRLQYVGELCRYLVNAPPHPLERNHKLEEAWGNGMRPDVWEKFRERFNIPVIHELYAGTDAMGAMFNRNRGPFSRNAIAVRGLLWNMKRGNVEVRGLIDPDTEELMRDSRGFAIKAGTNEPGEVLHKVDPEVASLGFKGYFKNDGAGEKRWLRNVFQKGDLYFRSGDMMRQDGDGRVYFVDRLGDTYRWKSENVSTNEVSDILGTFPQIAECAVYGVKVPNADGRCGCATIVPTTNVSPTLDNFDFEALTKLVVGRLPRYAVPIFLRMAVELRYTGTFKILKGQAKREGVDLDLINKAGSKDQVYWLPPGGQKYVPYKQDDWQALKSGKVTL